MAGRLRDLRSLLGERSMASLAELFKQLRNDPWRDSSGFSPEMIAAHDVLFGSDSSGEHHKTLNEWVEKHQPCLFGKMAAKLDAVRFCVVNRATVESSDQAVFEAIRDARLRWKRDAMRGLASAFVIVVASPELARAVPDDTVRD